MTSNGIRRDEQGVWFIPSTAAKTPPPVSVLGHVFYGGSYGATIGYDLAAELLEQQLARAELERDDQPAADVPEPEVK